MNITKKQFNYLALFTLVGFGLIGFGVIYFVYKKSPLSIFENGLDWYWQILIGGLYGLIISFIAKQIINSKMMADIRFFFAQIIEELNLQTTHILFYSFCAGVGEEILFRGTIQPILGIWLTSVIFIALHGYINPMNWRISIYGVFMIFLSAGLGYLYEHVGMISAMMAHFTVDVVLFSYLQKKNASLP